MLLDASTRAVFVKVAFGDFWKHNVEGVHDAQKIVLYKIHTELEELSTKKQVCQINLQAEVEEV